MSTPIDEVKRMLEKREANKFEDTVSARIIAFHGRGYAAILKQAVREGVIDLNDTISVAQKKMKEQREDKTKEGIFEGVVDEIKRVITESKTKEEAYQKSTNSIDILKRTLEQEDEEKKTVNETMISCRASGHMGYYQILRRAVREGVIDLNDKMSVARKKMKEQGR